MIGRQDLLIVCVQLRQIFYAFLPLLTAVTWDRFSLQEHKPNQANEHQQHH
jgi:hypothetical protein